MRLANKHIRFALSVIVVSGLCHGAEVFAAGQARDIDYLDSAEQMAVEAKVDARIAKDVGASYPDFPNLLAEDPANQQSPEIQESILTTLERFLKAGQSASPERRAGLLLAADRLAGHVLIADGNTPEEVRERDRLAADGLEFKYLELGGDWFYMHNLLWRIWKDYGKTEWGEWAFVLLLENGWDTSQACRNGNDQARPVILHGEEFLAGRPRSRHRLEVMFLVAQAYETWWSVCFPSAKPARSPVVKRRRMKR